MHLVSICGSEFCDSVALLNLYSDFENCFFFFTVVSRAVVPYSIFADPDPAVSLNVDPDPDPAAF